jgi:hypothetical protein
VISNDDISVGGGGAITAPGGIEYVSGSAPSGTTPAATQISAPVTDPYSYLPAPSQPANAYWTVSKSGSVSTYNLYPGYYPTTSSTGSKWPSSFTNNDIVIFHQATNDRGTTDGIYYLNSGLNINGPISATMATGGSESGGIMLYNASNGSSNGITITGGSGATSLSGLTSGIYQGILIFQARGATEDVKITGQGSLFSLTGTLYSPSATMTLSGQGTADIIGSSVVANTVNITGNGTVKVDYNSGGVLNQRILTLVE